MFPNSPRMPESYAIASLQFISTHERTDILPLFYLTPFQAIQEISLPVLLQFVWSAPADGRLLSIFLSSFSSSLADVPLQPAASVETQFEFDLHHVLPAMGSTAPTHEQSDYYGSRSTCKHALRVIFFEPDERILKSFAPRAREFRLARIVIRRR